MLSLPLTVIGTGPDHARLKAMAGPTVVFAGRVPDAELPGLFAGAKAFIFPGLDDFGIVAVEAMAAGTPVIAYKAGGSLDYVVPGKTGVFFDNQTVADVGEALQACERTVFDHTFIGRYAERFSIDTFTSKLTKIVEDVIST
jgi:glycosyltransferase involved in cell wall biosynthesis